LCHSVDEIDWEAVWEIQMELTSFKRDGIADWDNNTGPRERLDGDNDYTSDLLSRMRLSPECSVLDIGCGAGAVTIPLAQRVGKVTALDFSPMALEVLKEKAAATGLNNITAHNQDFSALHVGKNLNIHDVVLASRSLPMGSLKESLLKMNAAARNYCYLTWVVGGNDITEELCAIAALEYHPFPEYIIILNLLYSLGINANLEIFTVSGTRKFSSLDEAINRSFKGYEIESKEVYRRLVEHLKTRLTNDNGCYRHEFKSKWALIWWQK
jgi:SAM-dependent methyltransferase